MANMQFIVKILCIASAIIGFLLLLISVVAVWRISNWCDCLCGCNHRVGHGSGPYSGRSDGRSDGRYEASHYCDLECHNEMFYIAGVLAVIGGLVQLIAALMLILKCGCDVMKYVFLHCIIGLICFLAFLVLVIDGSRYWGSRGMYSWLAIDWLFCFISALALYLIEKGVCENCADDVGGGGGGNNDNNNNRNRNNRNNRKHNDDPYEDDPPPNRGQTQRV